MSRFARLVNATPPKSEPSESSQPPRSSQLSEQPQGGYDSSQLQQSSQPQESPQTPTDRPSQSSQLQESRLNLLASLPDAKGHMEMPFQLLDHLFRHLDPFEQAAYNQLCRLSWGWKQDRCRVSNPRLAERSNMSLAQVKKVVARLISKGLIEKTGNIQGYGKDQGVEYIVHAPSWVLSRSRQLGQSRQPQESSQLSQSTNIERIKDIDQRDALACPDCLGTNFYYPQGTSNGVARCRHERVAGK